MEKTAETLRTFEDIAAEFARGLRPRAHEATLITLSGELGAGKTAFVKAAARELGITETVNSPTFVLEKIYALPRKSGEAGFSRLIHIDAYRLERGSDLSALGFDELMRDPGNLVFLEWPEQVADGLPAPSAAVRIQSRPAGGRTLTFSVQ